MECAICFEVAEPFILPCNHSVCIDCYRNKDLKKCPFCRKSIKPVMVHHVEIHITEPYIIQPVITQELCTTVLCLTFLIIIVWLCLFVNS